MQTRECSAVLVPTYSLVLYDVMDFHILHVPWFAICGCKVIKVNHRIITAASAAASPVEDASVEDTLAGHRTGSTCEPLKKLTQD